MWIIDIFLIFTLKFIQILITILVFSLGFSFLFSIFLQVFCLFIFFSFSFSFFLLCSRSSKLTLSYIVPFLFGFLIIFSHLFSLSESFTFSPRYYIILYLVQTYRSEFSPLFSQTLLRFIFVLFKSLSLAQIILLLLFIFHLYFFSPALCYHSLLVLLLLKAFLFFFFYQLQLHFIATNFRSTLAPWFAVLLGHLQLIHFSLPSLKSI